MNKRIKKKKLKKRIIEHMTRILSHGPYGNPFMFYQLNHEVSFLRGLNREYKKLTGYYIDISLVEYVREEAKIIVNAHYGLLSSKPNDDKKNKMRRFYKLESQRRI